MKVQRRKVSVQGDLGFSVAELLGSRFLLGAHDTSSCWGFVSTNWVVRIY